jgi:Ca2+-transporting ATPase
MAAGVSRLAKKKAIVKKLNAIETLGCCEVICSDKTGTLTENKMKVSAIYDNIKNIYNLSNIKELVGKSQTLDYAMKVMALCNSCAVQNSVAIGDPTEVALCNFAYENSFSKKSLEREYKLVDEFSFNSNRKLMTTIHEKDGKVICLTKGGLDEVLACCENVLIEGEKVKLDDDKVQIIQKAGSEMAKKALRILAFAIGKSGQAEHNMTFVGFAGMIDPPRKEVFAAVKDCFKAGMTPIMITGDHGDTAFEIARQLGIAKNKKEVLLGVELDKLSDKKYLEIINKIKVYARVTPENKVRIVNAYRKLGKIVAMTGDGVNDAPCIKAANIGIGMGITGTDISKDTADIVVSDDNFATIIIAIEEGRRIYKNIEKTVKFLLAANGAEVISIFLITILFPNFVFLLPVHILFINLITDSIPSIALGFEPPEVDIMSEKPRKANRSLVFGANGIYILFFSIAQAAVIISVYLIGLNMFDDIIARSMAFYAFNIIQFFYIVSARTENYVFKSNIFKNKWILCSILLGLTFLLITALTPLHEVIHLVQFNYIGWLICIGLPSIILPISELYKLVYRKMYKKIREKG